MILRPLLPSPPGARRIKCRRAVCYNSTFFRFETRWNFSRLCAVLTQRTRSKTIDYSSQWGIRTEQNKRWHVLHVWKRLSWRVLYEHNKLILVLAIEILITYSFLSSGSTKTIRPCNWPLFIRQKESSTTTTSFVCWDEMYLRVVLDQRQNLSHVSHSSSLVGVGYIILRHFTVSQTIRAT